MQNSKFSRIRGFLKEKGYYIVLLLCAVAVGVSGFFLLRDRIESSEPTDGSTPASSTVGKADIINRGEVNLTDPTESGKTPARPVDGEVVYDYAVDVLAYNETTRDWRTHEGVDFRAELGGQVVAVLRGTVYAIYDDASFGTTVVLRHDDGYTTHYSNLAEEVLVKVGDSVKAGTPLGTIGESAGIETATQPHLHFAVYKDNRPVDPIAFLTGN